ncbi:D-glucuronyl C5-epimerase family protein [Microbacterium sp. JZ31]|uniref:D-glucuronyl C5-epimerase family protein n=1 Tax=Microbacterium sp. JZ31 TaxID=1906274 RepID=UPI0019331617|nr:D-glucuronyl C5-epimerase family protein [Microbacterium sp. JZ31]
MVAALAILSMCVVTGVTEPAPASANAVNVNYRQNAYAIRELPQSMWPYIAAGPGPLEGTNTYDDEGVSVRVVGGEEFDHPVLQAQFMLTRLSSYGHNGDPEYLARIIAHAERLIDNAVIARDAMYLPYPFDWALHGDRSDMMIAPWYSAMAQGQALSAFVRLYEATGNERYRTVADQLFASFKNLRAAGSPWTVNVDDEGYLWFEEYAKDPGADRSVNGHIFAIYGV